MSLELTSHVPTSDDRNPPAPPRHWWFPICVAAVVAAFLSWRMTIAGYPTFYHLIAVLFGSLLIATWFGIFGPARKSIRYSVATAAWFGLAMT
jgi:hypothetical protein